MNDKLRQYLLGLRTEYPNSTLSFAECFSSPERQEETSRLFKDTDVIFGHDVETGNVFIAFGLTLFEAHIADKDRSSVTMVVVDVRQSTDELERLLVAVHTAKGYHEYLPSGNVELAEIESLETLFRLDSSKGCKE